MARIDPDQAERERLEIEHDPAEFIALLNDPTRGGTPYTLPDGQVVPRVPGIRRWIVDDDYCGAISLRWQPGTTELPPYCLGHIGYAVVPWKRRRGHATAALNAMLGIARDEGLAHVDLVTDVENKESQRVITANGGAVVEAFQAPGEHGGFDALLFRVILRS
jgi:predicted acetyltransferase